MDMHLIINQMAVLFILIAIGYIAGKIKMLTPNGVNTLSKIVLNISTPSVILNSVLGDIASITGDETAYFMLLVLLAYVIFFLIAITGGSALGMIERLGNRKQEQSGRDNITHLRNDNRGLYISMIAFGNVGFMGFPIVNAIFGAQSMYYASLFNLVNNILLFSAGIIMISGKRGSFNFRLLLNATFIAAFISFIFIFSGLHAPFIVTEALELVSGMNTPCAMLVIGATLSKIPLKEVFNRWQLYPAALLKMVAIPVATWFIFKQFVTDEMMLGVLTVLSGMPIATVVAIIPIQYGGDDHTASGGVFLTTLISAVTIPLIVYLF